MQHEPAALQAIKLRLNGGQPPADASDIFVGVSTFDMTRRGQVFLFVEMDCTPGSVTLPSGKRTESKRKPCCFKRCCLGDLNADGLMVKANREVCGGMQLGGVFNFHSVRAVSFSPQCLCPRPHPFHFLSAIRQPSHRVLCIVVTNCHQEICESMS